MKMIIWDYVFIIALGVIFLVLELTNNVEYLMRLPFMSILIPYILGRYISERRFKKIKVENE